MRNRPADEFIRCDFQAPLLLNDSQELIERVFQFLDRAQVTVEFLRKLADVSRPDLRVVEPLHQLADLGISQMRATLVEAIDCDRDQRVNRVDLIRMVDEGMGPHQACDVIQNLIVQQLPRCPQLFVVIGVVQLFHLRTKMVKAAQQKIHDEVELEDKALLRQLDQLFLEACHGLLASTLKSAQARVRRRSATRRWRSPCRKCRWLHERWRATGMVCSGNSRSRMFSIARVIIIHVYRRAHD